MRLSLLLIPTLLFAGCKSDPAGPDLPLDPGKPVDPGFNPTQQSEYDRLQRELQSTANMTTAEFQARYQTAQTIQLAYDPTNADNLDIIQNSAVALNNAEMTALKDNGVVISDRNSYPSFLYGYQTLYLEDLPLYVSADSILHAVHRSYDEILKAIEMTTLQRELSDMLQSMRGNLAAGAASGLGTNAEADVDVYLAVALALLQDSSVPAVRGGDQQLIEWAFGQGELR